MQQIAQVSYGAEAGTLAHSVKFFTSAVFIVQLVTIVVAVVVWLLTNTGTAAKAKRLIRIKLGIIFFIFKLKFCKIYRPLKFIPLSLLLGQLILWQAE